MMNILRFKFAVCLLFLDVQSPDLVCIPLIWHLKYPNFVSGLCSHLMQVLTVRGQPLTFHGVLSFLSVGPKNDFN